MSQAISIMQTISGSFKRRVIAALLVLAFAPGAYAAIGAERSQPSDTEITNAVADRLLRDHGVEGHGIDVETVDGVVSLTGTADNVLAKRRAVRIAESVKGVRSVIDRVTVLPSGRSDTQIRSDVRGALFDNVRTEGYEVDVAVEDGVVTLTGLVDSWQEKELVERVASGVRGVLEVNNSIGVRQAERDDDEIAEDVRGALRWDRYVDLALVDVSVDDGRVILEGTVGSAAERSRAIANAWVAGTKSVDAKKLRVEPWASDDPTRDPYAAPPSDDAIAQAIEDGLLLDPRVVSEDVDVDVEHGVVTLRGSVRFLSAKDAAAQVARDTVGVLRVRNRLRVRPELDLSRMDAEVEERIERAWARDPYVDAFDLTALVADGEATLMGTVANHFDKARAESLAYGVTGVVDVNNDIDVVKYNDPFVYSPYVDDWNPYDYDWHLYRTETTKSDAAILRDIEEELWWSPFVDSDQVSVSVSEGVATLTGSVDDIGERRAATENALEGGAIRVVNELEIAEEGERGTS